MLDDGRGISVGRDTGDETEAEPQEVVSHFGMYCNVLSGLSSPTMVHHEPRVALRGVLAVSRFNSMHDGRENTFLEPIETVRNEHIRHKPL